jgi:hypothetical protein
MYDTYFLSIESGPITGDVMNTVRLSTWQYAPNTKNLITTKIDWETLKICQLLSDTKGISLHFVKMHPNFHLIYGILVCKYKNVMIMLQKEWENPLKIRFLFSNRG